MLILKTVELVKMPAPSVRPAQMVRVLVLVLVPQSVMVLVLMSVSIMITVGLVERFVPADRLVLPDNVHVPVAVHSVLGPAKVRDVTMQSLSAQVTPIRARFAKMEKWYVGATTDLVNSVMARPTRGLDPSKSRA